MIAKSILNHRLKPGRFFAFLRSIYIHGKTAELFSFIFWELKHKLGFYRSHYIQFNASPFLDLNEETLASCPFLEKTDINWHIMYMDKNGSLYGSTNTDRNQLYLYKDVRLILLFSLTNEITGVFIAESGTIFVCANGTIFRYSEGQISDNPVFEFSTNKSIFLRNGFTEGPNGALFVGEYVNLFHKKWHFAAYLYCSADDGKTWVRTGFLKSKGINKHIHIVKWSTLLNGLVLTDGDNKKKLWFNKSIGNGYPVNPGSGWKDITKRHVKMGGYTAMIETDRKVFFGTDYNGGTNFVVSTADLSTFSKRAIPDPYRRSIFTNMTITRQGHHCQIWAVLHGESGMKTKSLLMMSSDEGHTWNKIIEYDARAFQVIILNNSKSATDKLYISIVKQVPQHTADIIRVAEISTTNVIAGNFTNWDCYTVDIV